MKAVSSMATRHVLADLNRAAADAGLPELEITSLGGVDAAARVEEGEAFDLVFLASDALARLAGEGHVVAETVTPLFLSQVAVAVTAEPTAVGENTGGAAFADAAGVRDAIRAARRIGYSTGPSGTALVRMIDAWGLTDEVAGRLVQARPGIPVAKLLGDGEVDLGFQQLSELVGQPGVKILGVMPEDCAIDTVFSGAVATVASDAAAARAVLDRFAADAAAGIAAQHAFGRP